MCCGKQSEANIANPKRISQEEDENQNPSNSVGAKEKGVRQKRRNRPLRKRRNKWKNVREQTTGMMDDTEKVRNEIKR